MGVDAWGHWPHCIQNQEVESYDVIPWDGAAHIPKGCVSPRLTTSGNTFRHTVSYSCQADITGNCLPNWQERGKRKSVCPGNLVLTLPPTNGVTLRHKLTQRPMNFVYLFIRSPSFWEMPYSNPEKWKPKRVGCKCIWRFGPGSRPCSRDCKITHKKGLLGLHKELNFYSSELIAACDKKCRPINVSIPSS